MALERLQALATARIPDLDRAVIRRRREPCRIMGEDDAVSHKAMAIERLLALSTARIRDLDRAVVRRRCEPCRVVGEGDRVNHIAMALKRLQARTPFISYSRLYRDPLRLFLLKKTPYQATGWTKHECRCIH